MQGNILGHENLLQICTNLENYDLELINTILIDQCYASAETRTGK